MLDFRIEEALGLLSPTSGLPRAGGMLRATSDFLLSLTCSISSLDSIACRRTQSAAVFGLQKFCVFSSDTSGSSVSMALRYSRIGLFTALGGKHSALGVSFISNILSYSPSCFSKHFLEQLMSFLE